MFVKSILYLKHHPLYVVYTLIGAVVLYYLALFIFTPFVDTPLGILFTPSFKNDCGITHPENNGINVSAGDLSRMRCFFYANQGHREASWVYSNSVAGSDGGGNISFQTDQSGVLTLTSMFTLGRESVQSPIRCNSIQLQGNKLEIRCDTHSFSFGS